MMPLDWGWLTVTLIQILGVSMIITSLGFAYSQSIEQHRSLRAILDQKKLKGWLALGAAFLAAGTAFSEADWLQKGAVIGLASCLIWIAWRD